MSKEQQVSEQGWLLEKMHNGNVHYICADYGLEWTDDPNKALRLSRREDAEALCTIVEDCDKIAAHEWVPARADSTPVAQPPNGPSWEAVEIAEQLTSPAIGKLKIPEWRAMTNEIAAALDVAVDRQREVDAKAICYMCAQPERYQPPRDVEGFDKPCHFYTDSHSLRPNCNAAECKATAIRATKQQ